MYFTLAINAIFLVKGRTLSHQVKDMNVSKKMIEKDTIITLELFLEVIDLTWNIAIE